MENDSGKIDKSVKSYICSKCVQLLLSQSQEKLLRTYNFALEKGYPDKARAIKSFLEVNVSEPINRNTAKHTDGKGFMRTVGNDKGTGSDIKKRKKPSFYQVEPKKQAVF
jgi:hypothetical protein